MPTSCSIAAAHSSSASPGLGSNSPPRASDSCICSASRATCSVCGRSDSYWTARLRTAASRTFGEQRLLLAEDRAGQEDAVAQTGLGRLDARRIRRSSTTVCSVTAARQDDVAAPRLDPRHRAALRDRQRGERVDELVERRGADHEALDADVDPAGGAELRPLGGGGEVADRAAGADQAAAVACQPRRPSSSPATWSRSRCRSFLRAGRSGSPSDRNDSVIRTAPTGKETKPRSLAVLDLDQLHAAAADVEHDAVGQRRAVDRGDIAVMGLALWSRGPPPRSRSCLVHTVQERSRLPASRIALVANDVDVVIARVRSRGRSDRRSPASPGRDPSRPRAARRRSPVPRRSAPTRRARRCASTTGRGAPAP